jgi:glc operon protein GlcG
MANFLIKKSLSLDGAKILAARAVQKATELGVRATIAIVDNGGHLIYFERLDGTIIVSANITIGKAVTALTFNRPGKALEEAVSSGRTAMMANTGITTMVPLMGSYPIIVDGETVGAIAVGGTGLGAGENDEIIVLHALDYFKKNC